MRLVPLLILFVLSMSCKSEHSSTPPNIPIERTANLANGAYKSACLYNPDGNLRYTVRLDKNDNDMKVRYTLHSNPTCTGTWWYYDTYYSLVKSVYEENSNEEILIDLSVKSIKYKFNNSWYPKQHYCGLTDWNTASEREMTGVYCPDHEKLSTCTSHSGTSDSLSEREDKTIRAVGHKVYLRATYNEDTGVLQFPADDDSKGDNPDQRFGSPGDEDQIFELTKETPTPL